MRIGKNLHPTPHTPHPVPTKNFFSKPYLMLRQICSNLKLLSLD
ncbi:MAG: hypothetical protein O9332_20610 [Microcystis sp. LE19-10.1B]|nr:MULTISPECIES: hypothetical protein [unclassified Microcystis]MCZ8027724.1 hypothetical protein [Microcystis sp. LE19-10.1B]MCZ8363690.1 hypothetical protein [Microcystis sp. LE19-251.1A]